jgi:GT2 family glycosyltransferase
MKKIAIIILNYNNPQDTFDCLKSLEKINHQNYQPTIFLVDYGSNPISLSTINSKLPILLIRKNYNLGFAKANNLGIKKALKNNCDYILCLNNDTLVPPDFLHKMFEYLEKKGKVAAISPKIYFAKGFEYHKNRYTEKDKGKVIWYAGGKLDWQNIYGSHRGVDEVDKGQFDQVSDTDFLSGCCLLIKSHILSKVGLFNEKLFLYWEDTDLSQRFKKAGFQIKYFPQSYIWHKNAGSSGVGSKLHDYFLNRNRLWFGFKYAPMRTKLALLRQSLVQLAKGNTWTKKAIVDFYLKRMGQGTWTNEQ